MKIALNFFTVLFLFCHCSYAQTKDTLSSAGLKKLSLEELMNIEVTSVSKHTEKLMEVASAIQVITHEDIIRSGARTLPEALKLAPNLQVAQVNSSQWAISARGFNNVLANKLLVLIDGRTVYTPMYGGVFWDVQNLMLEDVERIEVISGPGGTLWGANAVNGVINVITKKASDTSGVLAYVSHGTNMPVMAGLRYGGKIKKDISYRVYGNGFKMGSVLDTLGGNANDDWEMIHGGFRTDWEPSKKDKVSLIANIYAGHPNPDGTDSTAVSVHGDNIVLRWNRQISERAVMQLQGYYDHTWRDFKNQFTENLKTYDIEWQNRQELGTRHILTYGFGARVMDHSVANLELFGFFPGEKTLELYNVFLQYEVMLIKERLRFTVGSKLEHNSYTQLQHQPNARLTFTPTVQQTIWAAASRAVRNPSRIDRDFSISIAPGVPFIQGNDTFQSESVIAYELGWRSQLIDEMTLSLSTFYNVYDDLRSAEPGPPPFGLPITLGNGVEGNTYGAEFSFNSRFNSWCTLRGGYTLMKKELEVKEGSNDLNEGRVESNDPAHQIVLQSNFEFSPTIELGAVVRYIDALPQPAVDSYTGLDMRLGWKLTDNFEFSIVGQNVLQKSHTEYTAQSPRREIERSIYGKVVCRF